MIRRSILIAALPALGALHLGCTQDFSVFEATANGGGPSSSSAGTGGAGASSSSASSSSSAASASSSGAASSSAASSSAASSSAASSSSGGTAEDCTNGVDDDGNGKVDCADPACMAGYTCVDKTPPGWNGPVALYDGDPATIPQCPPDHPTIAYQGHADLVDQPAVCAACTCAAPQVSCVPKVLTLTDDAACGHPVGAAAQPAANQCGPIQPPAGTQGFTAAAPTAIAGACLPGGGGKTLPPATWMRAGLACLGGGLGGGCGGNAACSGNAPPGFVQGLCVWHTGDLPCPPKFGDKHLFVDSVLDTRGCSVCSCGAPSAACTATTTVYADGVCGGTSFAVVNDGSCTVSAAGGGSIKTAVTAAASCAPGGGQPTGSIVVGPLETTVCCAP